MKTELNPVVFWSVVGVLAVAVLSFLLLRGQGGYKAKTEPDTFGQRALQGQPVYTPPPGAPIPGASGPMGAPGQPGGMAYPQTGGMR
jgi:hypothetical protein